MIDTNSVEFYNKLHSDEPDRWNKINEIILGVSFMIHDFCTEHRKYKIIDLGCGTGTLYTILDGRKFDCVGVDFSEEAINLARKRNPYKTFIVNDMTDTPYDSHSFDVVLAIGSYEHLRKITFEEPRRLVKDNGLFICILPEVSSKSIGWDINGIQEEWLLNRKDWIKHIKNYKFDVDDRNLILKDKKIKWTYRCIPI